jgi:streptogramin lyase
MILSTRSSQSRTSSLLLVLLSMMAVASLSCTARRYRYSAGDGGLATAAMIQGPSGLAVIDGVLYVAEEYQNAIRRIDLRTGRISRLPTSRELDRVSSLAADGQGRLLVVEASGISRVDPRNGVLAPLTVPGLFGHRGDGAPISEPSMSPHATCVVTADGDVYVSVGEAWRVRRVDGRTGVISTIAGTGRDTPIGDGGPAVQANVASPSSVAVDAAGHVYIAQVGVDHAMGRIRRIDAATRIIQTVAGPDTVVRLATGRGSRTGLRNPRALLLDGQGGLLFVDSFSEVCRLDLATGAIRVIAGDGDTRDKTSDPTQAHLNNVSALAIAPDGSLLIAELQGNRIRRLDLRTGRLTVLAGNGRPHVVFIEL